MSTISKGMAALQRSNNRAEKITIGGETFMFKRLTIGMEDELDRIIKDNQDDTLKPPAEPPQDAGEDAIKAYGEAAVEFQNKAAKVFRKLTAELMKYILLDETDKPLFAPEDDVYGTLNNVYAKNFFAAYTRFRNGTEATPAAAEKRFQG